MVLKTISPGCGVRSSLMLFLMCVLLNLFVNILNDFTLVYRINHSHLRKGLVIEFFQGCLSAFPLVHEIVYTFIFRWWFWKISDI